MITGRKASGVYEGMREDEKNQTVLVPSKGKVDNSKGPLGYGHGVGELIKARNEQGISQKKLEEMSGVKQPIIARIETGKSIPQVSTLIKLLVPLGKTLAIVPATK